MQARRQVRSQIAQARAAWYRRKNAQETAAPAGRHSERPGRHPRSRRVEPGAGRGRPAGGSPDLVPSGSASAGGARPAEQHPEGRHRAGEGGLGRDPGDPRRARPGPGLQGPARRSPGTWRTSSRRSSRPSPTSRRPWPRSASRSTRRTRRRPRRSRSSSAPRGTSRPARAWRRSSSRRRPSRWRGRPSTAAERQLDDARLRLSWTEIRSEIAGYVQDRPVQPGQPGRAGPDAALDPAELRLGRRQLQGDPDSTTSGSACRSTCTSTPTRAGSSRGGSPGFSPGTGLSESLLPPENATGNYVKVTQRLPVRIELAEPNPDETPLFVGLSVVPHVRFKERPTGPGAGERLHTFGTAAGPPTSAPARRARGRRTGTARGGRDSHERDDPATAMRRRAEGQAAGQPLDRRPDGHAGDVHGGARHLDRQRRPALHRRRALAVGRSQAPGS